MSSSGVPAAHNGHAAGSQNGFGSVASDVCVSTRSRANSGTAVPSVSSVAIATGRAAAAHSSESVARVAEPAFATSSMIATARPATRDLITAGT
jgi:hypothetical protein